MVVIGQVQVLDDEYYRPETEVQHGTKIYSFSWNCSHKEMSRIYSDHILVRIS